MKTEQSGRKHGGRIPAKTPNYRRFLARRRLFQIGLAAAAAVAGCTGCASLARPVKPGAVTFGVFADPQYAEKPPAMGRFYRDSSEKLEQFVERMNELDPAFVVGLGDFTDSGPSREAVRGYLRRMVDIYGRFNGDRHYVMGNHDLDTLTKSEFRAATGMPAAHYSFDRGPIHFVVLDANHGKDFTPASAGNLDWTDSWIPPAQQKWLARDLARASIPVIVFVHQRLDDDTVPHTVKNAPDVRAILERSGRVVAVFQGHDHAGAYGRINGIHYVTFRGMVEGAGLDNNAYAVVTVSANGETLVQGFGTQKTMRLLPPPHGAAAQKPEPRPEGRGRN